MGCVALAVAPGADAGMAELNAVSYPGMNTWT
jgi:hypothetical protein